MKFGITSDYACYIKLSQKGVLHPSICHANTFKDNISVVF